MSVKTESGIYFLGALSAWKKNGVLPIGPRRKKEVGVGWTHGIIGFGSNRVMRQFVVPGIKKGLSKATGPDQQHSKVDRESAQATGREAAAGKTGMYIRQGLREWMEPQGYSDSADMLFVLYAGQQERDSLKGSGLGRRPVGKGFLTHSTNNMG